MTEQTFFFIVSNGRTGSTWLETSLGRLPDVAVDWETKWRPLYDPGHAHRVIPDGQGTCRGLLRGISETSPVVGSKLTLDPYRNFPFEEVPDLLAAVEPEIRIIHLKRSYFDILLSFSARGGVNLIHDPAEMEELIDIFGNRNAMLAELLSHTVRLAGKRLEEKIKTVTDDVGMIFLKMFVYFLNDLVGMELARRARRSLHVKYDEINDRFHEIALFTGARCDAETAAHIVANPVTTKLERLHPTLMENWRPAQEMGAIFDEAVSEYRRRGTSLFDVWQGTQIIHFKDFERLQKLIQQEKPS